MQEIIAVTGFEHIDTQLFEQSLRLLPVDKQHKITRYRQKSDQLRALIGEITVRLSAMNRTGRANHQLQFATNEYGKPFLVDAANFSYNVTHSGSWVVCAIDETDVGIDVEQIQPIEMSIAERFFAPEEVQDLFALPEHDRLNYFFDLWTLKESYIKAVGKGLSIPLDSFYFRRKNGHFEFHCDTDGTPRYVRHYSLDVKYKLAVCAAHGHLADQLIQRNAIELCKEFIVKKGLQ